MSNSQMSNYRTPFVLAIVALAGCLAAKASNTNSDMEVAYVAAKLQQADFDREDTLCDAKPYRQPLAAARATFERANPGYVAALSLATPPERVDDLTERNLERMADTYERDLPTLVSRPRDALCKQIVSTRGGTDFQALLASARQTIAWDSPPPPEFPVRWMTDDELGAVVGAVLRDPKVSTYLHPDKPGRVPVRVALAAPYEKSHLPLTLYNAPVQTARTGDRQAIQLTIKPQYRRYQVEVKIPSEGVFGYVYLERVDAAWLVTAANLYE